MVAGLPGTGIGGMYYLILSIWMPVHGLFRKAKGDFPYSKKGIIKPQLFLTVLVIAAMWVTGWLLGLLLAILLPGSTAVATNIGSFAVARNVIRVTPLIITLVTLTLVYIGMRAIRLLVRWRSKRVVPSIGCSPSKRRLVATPLHAKGAVPRFRRTFSLPAARSKRVPPKSLLAINAPDERSETGL
jgi:hypothetical protein